MITKISIFRTKNRELMCLGQVLAIAGILMFSALFLSACGNVLNSEDKLPVLEFKSRFEVESKKLSITGNIARSKTGETEINIGSPEALAGLKFKHSGSENLISKDGLTYKTDELILPGTSDLTAIFEAIDYMAGQKDEEPFFTDSKEMAFIGKISAGKFELRADKKTGFITEIKAGEQATVKFFGQEKLTS